MDFYYVRFLKEFLNDEIWERAQVRPDYIVVTASNFEEANEKINKCVDIYNNHAEYNERFRITSKIVKANGLKISHNFNGGLSCFPI